MKPEVHALFRRLPPMEIWWPVEWKDSTFLIFKDPNFDPSQPSRYVVDTCLASGLWIRERNRTGFSGRHG